jgi:hypothetical protein
MGLSEHQISRRDLIKKSSVAGAIIWSAPVIESVTSRAAAQSTGCSSANFSASWIYVVYTYTSGGVTATSYIGFSKGDTTGTCTPASNPHGVISTPTCSTGYIYTLESNKGAPETVTETKSLITTTLPYGAGGGCSLFTISGGQVGLSSSGVTNGVQIVAAFCFGASNLTAVCVSGASGGCFANCD